MIPGLKVIVPGLHTTIQDLGRRGYQSQGVPVSGPLDRIGFTLANALTGNPTNTPALEILMLGPVLEAVADSVRLALVGAAAIVASREDERLVQPGQSVRLKRGERLRTGSLGDSACAYLAVEGGFDVPLVLGSAATYTRNLLGGLNGRALQEGDILPVRQPDAVARPEFILANPFDTMADASIRVVLGPQQGYFTKRAVETFLSAPYMISPHADRAGFRLDGPKLEHARDYNIVSDGIVTGAIQVPGSGQPIVLLADAQTTGGYPKIATVASADIPLVGRRRPGSHVRFVAVSREEAEAARRAQDQDLRRRIEGVRLVSEAPRVDLAALYDANLVGGVSSALD